ISLSADGTCAGVRCHPDAICDEEALLGPVCVCRPGYKGDGRKCTGGTYNLIFIFLCHSGSATAIAEIDLNIDECSDDDNKCHQEAECINTFGSYNCSCKPGFEGDGYNCRRKFLFVFSKTNLDLLAAHPKQKTDGTCAGIVCVVDAVCVTTQNGAQVCECKAGFTGNGLDCRGKQTCK
ncbi:unnamed protein product, partial [Porites lobata]